jgi:hypothetical protein
MSLTNQGSLPPLRAAQEVHFLYQKDTGNEVAEVGPDVARQAE